MNTNPAKVLRDQLVAMFADSVSLRGTRVLDAMRAVPREVFVPAYYIRGEGSGYQLLRKHEGAWLSGVYTDEPLITQLDGVRHADDGGAGARVRGRPTCSASQPSLVARMLDLLGVEPGDRVLEVGAGTGYNAALLCELAGERNVVAIEYDASLADKASARLADAGYRPHVVVGDGGLGYAPEGPYDRIITTCSFPAIYPAWLGQLDAERGLAVATLLTGIPVGILVVLTIDGPGAAVGRIVPQQACFMGTRAASTDYGLDLASAAGQRPEADRRSTGLRWSDVTSADGLFVLTALLLDAWAVVSFTDDGGKQFELYSDDGSVAMERDGRVVESGPRRLWDELEEIAALWERLGQPDREEFELTISFDDRSVRSVVSTRGNPDWSAPALGLAGT